jgi:hypothetical protein
MCRIVQFTHSYQFWFVRIPPQRVGLPAAPRSYVCDSVSSSKPESTGLQPQQLELNRVIGTRAGDDLARHPAPRNVVHQAGRDAIQCALNRVFFQKPKWGRLSRCPFCVLAGVKPKGCFGYCL